jgi:septin family protein
MNPRVLKVGEKVTGKYNDMVLGQSKKFYRLKIGNEDIYLPKDVGNSVLKSHLEGYNEFTITRTYDVYEIKPLIKSGGAKNFDDKVKDFETRLRDVEIKLSKSSEKTKKSLEKDLKKAQSMTKESKDKLSLITGKTKEATEKDLKNLERMVKKLEQELKNRL